MNDDGLGNTTSKSKEIQVKIMYEHKRKRMNVEHDRLSSLPDDLIHKILSFMDTKLVVQTCVLSSRWRFVWTSTPYLKFSTWGYSLLEFSNIVEHVLSGRNNEIDVYSVTLYFRGEVSQVFVKIIFNYAFSHNVQEMTITSTEKKNFPLSLFNSVTLKHLTLCGYPNLRVTSSLELPSLTTLHLHHVTLYDDNSDSYISKCVNLKNLTLDHCYMMGSCGFTICHPQLLSLTLKFVHGVVKAIAPQLKNISLALSYNDYFPCFENALPSLEKADICIHYPCDALKIINMLQQLCSNKYLTINMEILELLSSKMDLISNQPSPFANLETLKVYPLTEILIGQTQKKVDVSALVKSYLLDSSPNATLTMVSREEVRAAKNETLAQECFLKIHCCWEDLSELISYEEQKVSCISSELKYIEELLTHIPESKKVKMQELFASMCEEADTVMNKTLERLKI
ncbi:F-box/LRR-repeat protein At3g26922-like [Rutidosis leptorrhynchoides]|uniref:F-box/LRR-repeat protein At3g26922-like n=1 Tax=Rutidosis leptorrhynchoides TaxID=125765 RepID=UPI003A993E20